jgi:hypothetical protein
MSPAVAMAISAATATGLLQGVQPLGLGLEGVWGAMAMLMVSRLATLVWRYQDPSGPLPPQQRRQRHDASSSALAGPLGSGPLAIPLPHSPSEGPCMPRSKGLPAGRGASAEVAPAGAPVQHGGAQLRWSRRGKAKMGAVLLANNAVLAHSMSPKAQQEQQPQKELGGPVGASVEE